MSETKGNIVAFTEENYAAVVEGAKLPVLLDVGATWCVDCRRVHPLFEKFAADYAGKILFASIDVDDSPALKEKLGVRHIPTFVYLKDGKVVSSLVEPKSIAPFKEFVEKTLA